MHAPGVTMTALRTTSVVLLTAALALGTATMAVGDGPVDGPMPGPLDEPVPTPVVDCRTIAPAPYADLSGCDLSGADLTGANLSYADLSDANLRGVDLTDATLVGVSAARVDLSSAVLWRTVLVDADLTDADLSRASFRGANLSGATLTGADLDDSAVRSSNLSGVDLTDADLSGADLNAVDLSGADLTGADASGVDFRTATIAGTRFTDADLSRATLDGLPLSGLSLAGASLASATLIGARLVRTDLTDADLTDANLRKADLSHAAQGGVTWHNTMCPDGFRTTAAPCPMSTQNEAGFLRIPAIPYSFRYRPLGVNADIEYTTTPANLFYSFQAADGDGMDPETAPLFVMLNGGPGAATTANLMANNTAQWTVNTGSLPPGSPGLARNPHSWTSMGNLLYIDPPLTGFSYNEDRAATSDFNERVKEFLLRGNFNTFIDADQVLRAVLMFLDDRPDLADNPVVLVGESYGGVRVTTMLNMLLFSQDYGSKGPLFRDQGLVDAITDHFADIGVTGRLTPEVVARQFGRQVLIQPQLSNHQGEVQAELYWPDDPSLHSVIDDVATASGNPGGFTRDPRKCRIYYKGVHVYTLDPGSCAIMAYVPSFGRDRYNWLKDKDWSDEQDVATAAQYTELGKLNTILGVDVSTIRGFGADARNGLAYSMLLRKPSGRMPGGALDLPGVDEQAWLDSLEAQGIDTTTEPSSFMGPLYEDIVARSEQVEDAIDQVPGPDSLTAHFGKLGDADSYYRPWNEEIYAAFTLNAFAPEFHVLPIHADSDPTFGDMFLRNIRYVQTFLTDATYDLVINSEALPLALARHAGVRAVERQPAQGAGTGRFVVSYDNGSPVRLYYPHYGDSGHAVAATEPAKLRDDVATWLNCTADATCFTD